MARAFVLPDLGEGLSEAEVLRVLVAEGDVVAEDAPLLEVETDKATVEIPSPMGGRVVTIHVTPGQTVRVGDVLVTLDDGGVAAPAPATEPVPATPATRRLARELGVDLHALRPSGPGGRVTDDDVRAAASGAATGPERAPGTRPLAPAGLEPPPLPRFEQWGPVERRPLSHLRRTIAERMTLSAARIPHVSHLDRADVTDLDALIQRSVAPGRAHGVTLTLTAFLLKAAALALGEHPHFNASLDAASGELILKRYCHLGVAVATERGLIVPVIRDVDRKPVLELQGELSTLVERVRGGRATLDDMRGGCFTITNLGALGGTGALPIINYPEVAILGVARARLEPVVADGRVVPRMLLPLTLTFDHRVADGADAARFAAALVSRLEAPERLLLGW